MDIELRDWYVMVAQKFPEGTITQAKAADVLGITRLDVNRYMRKMGIRCEYYKNSRLCLLSLADVLRAVK